MVDRRYASHSVLSKLSPWVRSRLIGATLADSGPFNQPNTNKTNSGLSIGPVLRSAVAFFTAHADSQQDTYVTRRSIHRQLAERAAALKATLSTSTLASTLASSSTLMMGGGGIGGGGGGGFMSMMNGARGSEGDTTMPQQKKTGAAPSSLSAQSSYL